jgi:monooxygenase
MSSASEAPVGAPEHFDVVIVGAGLSGVGAGVHLRQECPGRTFAILEEREASGGTWDLFRYPGIRSDSDMFTLGYSFKPWREAKAIADGPSILRYIRETAREHGIEQQIRYRHKVVGASWSSQTARWTVDAERTDTGELVRLTCSFLYGCTGYYRYDEGYTPHFEGRERFEGTIVHPQHWPKDLDYAGKRIVVIGSGATAVTLLPALAAKAAHVTMLQRSPSYVVTLPAEDPIARLVRRVLPPRYAYPVVRWKNVLLTTGFFQLSRRRPGFVKKMVRRGLERNLPASFDIDTHFTPRYDPWDQRLCLVPDGDMFEALSSGRASIVTDTIETFTEHGIKLGSGEQLEADVIVTATGLNLRILGDISLTVDGQDVRIPDTVGYKGMMFSGVPNCALALGYTNASWTLKADLVSHYVCRLLNHMAAHGYDRVMPRTPDPSLPTHPFIDLQSGYVLRSLDKLPKQGDRTPWRLHQNYARDIFMLKRGPVQDDAIEFARVAGSAPESAEPPLAAAV